MAPEAIRQKFPALRRLHRRRPVAYFDGPGGTQVPVPVVEAMTHYLFHRNSNAHWAFPTSVQTDRTRADARRAMEDLLGADPGEVWFGANMTTLTFLLSEALGQSMNPGEEIVVTELDHHANVDPWMALGEKRKVTIRVIPMDPETGALDVRRFEDLLSVKTRLVALGAASNALGTITDIPPLARLAHDAGAQVFVDAVHLAPHRRIQVRTLGCDYLACSAYKFYGPHVGMMWGRRELLEDLEVRKVQPAPDTLPERMETGTANAEAMAGTTAAVDFLASLATAEGTSRARRLDLAFAGLVERESALLSRLWDGLSAIGKVKLYGPRPHEPRTPTVSFTVSGMPAREVSARLAEEASAFLSHGDFYAATAVDRLGLRTHGLVRAGISCYTTEEEVDRLVEGVERIAG
jgi:cysteine desulfurase family protein (TIGR01976 family)